MSLLDSVIDVYSPFIIIRASRMYEVLEQWLWNKRFFQSSSKNSALLNVPASCPPPAKGPALVSRPLCHISCKVSRFSKAKRGSTHLYVHPALMIYVSSIFMTQNFYNFATMMQVYTLVLFSVTFASQFLDFSGWRHPSDWLSH